MITVCQAAELDTPGRLAWARQEKESKTRPNSCSIQPRCGGGLQRAHAPSTCLVPQVTLVSTVW